MNSPRKFRPATAAAQCRTEATAQRMCPIFRATPPRRRRRGPRPNCSATCSGPAPTRGAWPTRRCGPSPTCASTARCARSECPAHVDVPRLMLEAKAAHVAEHGLDRADWVMARLRHFSAMGSTVALLANHLLPRADVALGDGEVLRRLADGAACPASPFAASCGRPSMGMDEETSGRSTADGAR